MKFSTNYLFYPDNKSLEKAVEHYKSLVSDDASESVSADNRGTVMDNFIYTRGNFEQHRYSANVFEIARETFVTFLTDKLQEDAPSEWAEAHNSLGNILAALGQSLRDVDLYMQSIASFTSALEVYSQEDSPLEWAATQSNLGTALQALGRQESDSKLMSKSVDAYTAALLVYTRKETPEEWPIVMFQLGAAFHTYGSLLKGNRNLQKSVVSYKNALAELDADLYALELTATHNNRGAVLTHLGESEENVDRIEEAIRAYETALTVSMEQQLPFHFAVLIRVNKATANSVLAKMTKNSALSDETADEFELIIECFPHALQPLCLKHCEEQLSKARSLSHTTSRH
jgi:tetratricopeptide (TPR) repeat protein